MCTFSSGVGKGVSMAPACGCTSSGQLGSHSQSAVPHLPQKCRCPVLYRMWSPSTIFAW